MPTGDPRYFGDPSLYIQCAVGRVPPLKRSNSPDAAAVEIPMPVLFVASALCVLGVLALRPVLGLIVAQSGTRG
jgi:hypothetical protein